MSGLPLDAEPGLIGTVVGGHRVAAKIGEGGMGAVYLAEHPVIGKQVAIKVLHGYLAADREIVSRFFTEATAVSRIGHKNIVDVLDSGVTDNGTCYITMELLEGEGLGTVLEHERRLPLMRAVKIALQVADALDASHGAGIIHRDLKPENVYLLKRGADEEFIKVLDFGIAKLMGDHPGVAHRTRSGVVIGTPAYMSPEQCAGQADIDRRTDIYALGTILFQMLAGRCPFEEDNIGRMLLMQMTQPVPKVREFRPEIPPPVEAVIDKALSKNRDTRYQTVAQFSQDLRAAAGVTEEVVTGSTGHFPAVTARWLAGESAEVAPERLVGLPTPRRRTPVPPAPSEPLSAPPPPAEANGAATVPVLAAGPDLNAPYRGDQAETFRISPEKVPPELVALRQAVQEERDAQLQERQDAEAAAAAATATATAPPETANPAPSGGTTLPVDAAAAPPEAEARAEGVVVSGDLTRAEPEAMPPQPTNIIAAIDVDAAASMDDAPTLGLGDGEGEGYVHGERTAVAINPFGAADGAPGGEHDGAPGGEHDGAPGEDDGAGMSTGEPPTTVSQVAAAGLGADAPALLGDGTPLAEVPTRLFHQPVVPPMPPTTVLPTLSAAAATATLARATPPESGPARASSVSVEPTRRIENAPVAPDARHDETGRVVLPERTATVRMAGGDTTVHGPPRSRAWLWVLSIVGGVGVGVLGYAVFVHRGAGTTHDVGDADGDRGDHGTSRADVVRLELDSHPRGAKVRLGDEVVGLTPTHVDLPADGNAVELVFTKAGYASATRKLKVTESRELSVTLERLDDGDSAAPSSTGEPHGAGSSATTASSHAGSAGAVSAAPPAGASGAPASAAAAGKDATAKASAAPDGAKAGGKTHKTTPKKRPKRGTKPAAGAK